MTSALITTTSAIHKSFTLSGNQLVVITCLYLALVLNYPFLNQVFTAVTSEPDYNVFFLISVPILLTALFVFINSMMSLGKALKPVLILTLFISSLLFYATTTYGTVFDYSMVQNTFETDSAETLAYFNLYGFGFILAFGVIPSLFIYKVNVKEERFLNMLVARFRLFSISAIIVLIIAALYYANYAAVGRNNSGLVAYITPYKFIDASSKYIKRNFLSSPPSFTLLDQNPSIEDESNTPKVTVLVVGETARAQNFSLNGYAKHTNRYTDQLGVISFNAMSSCGTATAVSLPCMFSRLNHSEFEKRAAAYQQNVIDIISLAGADVLWVNNNNGGCKDVCNRVATLKIETNSEKPLCDGEYCLDEALLAPLNDKLQNLTHQHTVIVLHMMGSHGPTYFKRYPKDKTVFVPDCQRSDIQNCSQEELINTYDNTIAYTDFVLRKIIRQLQRFETQTSAKTSMLYISDHGESLGEKGIYLHGLPYAFAPEEQTHVPMIYWQTRENHNESMDCLQQKASEPLSHDKVFDIVLGLTSVNSKVYQRDNDVFADCRML